jgi:hypothetical protein
MAAAAAAGDDSLPGDRVEDGRTEGAERHPHGPRAARLAEDGGHLAVRRDLASRHFPHDAVDEPVEWRRTPVVVVGA